MLDSDLANGQEHPARRSQDTSGEAIQGKPGQAGEEAVTSGEGQSPRLASLSTRLQSPLRPWPTAAGRVGRQLTAWPGQLSVQP